MAQAPGWQPRSPAAASAEAAPVLGSPRRRVPAAATAQPGATAPRAAARRRCGRAAVGPAFATDTGAAAPPGLSQGRPPRGPPRRLAPLSLEGSERFTPAGWRGPAQRPQSPGWEVRGCCRRGGGWGGGGAGGKAGARGKLPEGSELLPRGALLTAHCPTWWYKGIVAGLANAWRWWEIHAL